MNNPSSTITRFSYAVFLLISLTFTFMYSASPYATGAISFYKSWMVYVFLIFGFSWAYYEYFGRSVMPFGDYDPETYPLQRLGYGKSVIIALSLSVLLMFLFGGVLLSTKSPVIPVPEVLSSVGGTSGFSAYSLFTGGSSFAKGLANSIPVEPVEDTLLILAPMMAIWLFSRFILSFIIPKQIANWVGIVIGTTTTGLIFSFVYHIFAYQAVAVYYWKAFFFVLLCGLSVALTGHIFPVMFTHLFHNFITTYFAFTAVNYSYIIYPMGSTILIKGENLWKNIKEKVLCYE